MHQVTTALEQAIHAAKDFKYWLDIQPKGQLFHPAGGDPRNCAAYQSAANALLAAEQALASGQKTPTTGIDIRCPPVSQESDTPHKSESLLDKGAFLAASLATEY
ncbi:hypothetical protein YWS52_14250 [Chitiniphilus shinanonensis]